MDLAKVIRYLKACEQTYRDSTEEHDDRESSCGYDFYEMDAMATAFREAWEGLERGEPSVDEAIEKMERESAEYAESRAECPWCGHATKDGTCLDPACDYDEEKEDAA
jgi:hypothetical protein